MRSPCIQRIGEAQTNLPDQAERCEMTDRAGLDLDRSISCLAFVLRVQANAGRAHSVHRLGACVRQQRGRQFFEPAGDAPFRHGGPDLPTECCDIVSTTQA